MNGSRRGSRWIPRACGALAVGWACAAAGADWPTYRHDIRRSAVTEEALALPLKPAWTYVCPQPPAPAWPDPFQLINRLDFDYAPQPVVAEGIVCFGSSADDTVRALDVKTGKEKWHFIAGGPVRFAPQIDRGKVYFAADDGVIYCLDAGSGKAVWTVRAAPADERMVGQHRMISRWPVRTGVLVTDGVVYGVAGMWQSEGMLVYALEADTGRELWCNDASGYSAQGALLASDDLLLVPNGNERPTPLNRRTGAPVAWPKSGQPGAGGTWQTIDRNKLYAFAYHRSSVLMIQPYALTNGLTGRCWGADVVPQLTLRTPWKPGQVQDKGKVSAIVHEGKPYARRAYGIALAKGSPAPALLLGDEGAVIAQDPNTQRELWRAAVRGEAREIAVADGRLFVGTSSGAIYCFEPGKGGPGPVISGQSSAASHQLATQPLATDRRSPITDAVRTSGMDRGFALVIGDPDARLSLTLVAQTQLRVVNVLTDAAAAQALRERLLAGTTSYGSRLHVQTVERLDRLPFARYFANAVIVAAPAPGLSGPELYRVLRPCGGIMLLPGLKRPEADALVAASGATARERRSSADGARVVRGKLPGALDWDTNPKEYTTDQSVRWPLRLLWFGGPATRQVQNAEQGAPGPAAGNGRYIMFSEQALTAVDAYNGEVLWSRPIPRQWPLVRDVDGMLVSVSEHAPYGKADLLRGCRLNDDAVILQLGRGYWRGRSDAFIRLDARSGEQTKIHGPWLPSPAISLATPRTWPVDVDTHHSGTLSLEAGATGLVVTLATRDPVVTPLDAWELFFDLRPPESRYGLYERGAFNVRVAVAQGPDAPPSWSRGNGLAFPSLGVSGARTADGTVTTVVVPWSELEAVAGTRLTGFGFAATLNSRDGAGSGSLVRRHLFGDWAADGINNGWAAVTIGDSAPAPDTSAPPAIVAGPSNTLKEPAGRAWGGRAANATAIGTPAIHPLTGEPVPKVFGVAPVCGASYYAGALISGRGTICDLIDNSGFHPVGGVKTGCTVPQLIALGMLIISEETGHCVCNYPLRTSLAMAPADRRLNEDWAQYYERDADTVVRQAHLNFGAAGDRRDPAGQLWLGFPRRDTAQTPEDFPNCDHPLPYPQGMRDAQTGLWYRRPIRPAVWVPMQVDALAGFGPYRFSTDRVAIQGTDRPWLYGSGYRGIKRATLQLSQFKPLASGRASAAPVVDGKLAEAMWQDAPASVAPAQPLLPFTETRIRFRHDDQSLYVGLSRPPSVFRPPRAVRAAGTSHGAFVSEPRAWQTGASKPDEPSPKDNLWRLILSDRAGRKAVHLTVTAGGLRADALGQAGTTNAADRTWNAAWQGAAVADTNGLTIEMAIPWAVLEGVGLSRDQLAVNCLMYDPGIGLESLTYLGMNGADACANFTPLGLGAPAPVPPRAFTVRLHFAEPDANATPGQRVFAVKLQGQTVLQELDIAKEAGGPRRALVREFTGIRAAEALVIEFAPAAPASSLTPGNVPVICALELTESLSEKESR